MVMLVFSLMELALVVRFATGRVEAAIMWDGQRDWDYGYNGMVVLGLGSLGWLAIVV